MTAATGPPPEGGPRLALLQDRRTAWTLIAGGVMALVIVAVVGFSGAYFTSTSRSPGNEYVAAGMGLDLARTGQIVDGDDLLPGDVRTGDQTVTNTAHVGLLRLEVLGLDPSRPLAQVLLVTIRQTAPALADPVYDGTLAQLGSLRLGRLEKDASRTFAFTVTWPAGEDALELSGETVSLDFDWQLESVP